MYVAKPAAATDNGHLAGIIRGNALGETHASEIGVVTWWKIQPGHGILKICALSDCERWLLGVNIQTTAYSGVAVALKAGGSLRRHNGRVTSYWK